MTMKLLVITILFIVGASTASVLRDERAISTEEEHANTQTPTSSTAKAICAQHTPCAWSMYKPVIKFIEINVTNAYCVCEKGLECIINEDDVAVSAYVYRCRPPIKDDSTTRETS